MNPLIVFILLSYLIAIFITVKQVPYDKLNLMHVFVGYSFMGVLLFLYIYSGYLVFFK